MKSVLINDKLSPFYHAEVYDNLGFPGMETANSYLDEIALAVNDEDFFNNFKSPLRAPRIYTIFFMFYTSYRDQTRFGPMDVALQCVDQYSPHLLSKFKRLAAQEKVGNPEIREFLVPAGDSTWADHELDSEVRYAKVDASVHVPKFLYELMCVEKAFNSMPGTIGFDGWHVMEIGGGYGGFANTMSEFHDVASYTVVDLGTVNLLISKYLQTTNSKAVPKLKTINAIAPYTPPPQPPTIDLITSFFCISEQTDDVVDEYIARYIRFARRGYLQLNYDTGVGTKNEDKGHAFDVMKFFRKIYLHHPSAVLLPPSPCTVYESHRIVWGPKIGESFIYQKSNRISEMWHAVPNWG